MKRLIVDGLERLDGWLDQIPSVGRDENGRLRIYRESQWGCRLRLAYFSDRLDQRWQTGVWRQVSKDDQ